VFTRTKHRADRLAKYLVRHGVHAERIHGNRSQAQRTQALAGFKEGKYRVLVATDIAARGIDIDALGHVVNFDVPKVPEDYIHRVGRTARRRWATRSPSWPRRRSPISGGSSVPSAGGCRASWCRTSITRRRRRRSWRSRWASGSPPSRRRR